MIKFERYPHINDLISYYLDDLQNKDVAQILNNGITSEKDALLLSEFIWEMVDKIHFDASNNKEVLGSIDNTDMLPDLGYEITKYMRDAGYYSTWEAVSENSMK